jgi:hypothetical protein
MASAALATLPPTRPVNWLAKLTPTTGRNGSGCSTEPSMAMELPICGNWEKTMMTGSHAQFASWKTVAKSTSLSWPMSR